MLLLPVIDWLADVIASVADIIATSVLADDIAMVVDVKTTHTGPKWFNIYHKFFKSDHNICQSWTLYIIVWAITSSHKRWQ